MNFKLLLLFIFMILLLGCGVKAKPLSPPEKAIPAYINSYTEEDFVDSQSSKKEK